MTINRGWTRRAMVSPAPWGRALTPAWTETALTFRRQAPVLTNRGNFTPPDATPVVVLQTYGHADLNLDGSDLNATILDSGPIIQHQWTFLVPIPADPATWPAENDTVTFRPVGGDHDLTLRVKHCHIAEQIADHFQIETQEID